jgi:hypothetical protein
MGVACLPSGPCLLGLACASILRVRASCVYSERVDIRKTEVFLYMYDTYMHETYTSVFESDYEFLIRFRFAEPNSGP